MMKFIIAALFIFVSTGALADNDLKPTKQGGKNEAALFGYTDSRGEWVIKPQFKFAYEFADNGLAIAIDPSEHCNVRRTCYGYINKKGGWAIPPEFHMIGAFSNGLAPAKRLWFGKWGYIGSQGEEIIAEKFVYAKKFSANGLAPASEDGKKFGYINKTGEWAIRPQFEAAFEFSEGDAPAGMTVVRGEDGRWLYISESGDLFERQKYPYRDWPKAGKKIGNANDPTR